MALASDKNYYWWVERQYIGVVEEKTVSAIDNNDPYVSISDSGKKIRIHSTRKASYFTSDLTEVSELPTQFHETLCYKVIADFYKLPGETFNLQLATYFDGEYEKGLREAKKFARRQHQDGAVIRGHSF